MGGPLLNRSTPIAGTSLRGLHPRSIEGVAEILQLLERARENHCVFHRGLNTEIDLETAQLERIGNGKLIFEASNFARDSRDQVFLNFKLEDRPYFFATTRTAPIKNNRLSVRIPETIFYSERRDRLRRSPGERVGDPGRVKIEFERGEVAEGFVTDISPGGLGLLVHCESVATSGALLNLKFLDGAEAGSQTRAQLRNWRPVAARPGWTQIGVVRTKAEMIEPIEVEYWTAIMGGASEVREAEPVEAYLDSIEPQVLRFPNRKGEEIVALVDSWGDPRGATAVVIPNGWGQTKEALLLLARTIVATFRAAGEPICVVRFDGIRKRGESHNDPPCRIPGREYLHFVFSQGVEDIEEVARFLRESSDFGVSSIVLVSFSAAAIEARKAMARDRDGLISAWISVVGSPDLQSMTRSISGGVDFALGYERGMRFGFQELLGVVVDIDRIAIDAAENGMTFIEESRSDLAGINAPISWYHGRYDAWVEFDRVRDLLSHGNIRNRRLVIMPTGHRLGISRIAGDMFFRIATEVGRLIGKELSPCKANSRELRKLRIKESERIPAINPALQEFWRDYLIGRDRSFGSELLASGSAYRRMMETQVSLLRLRPGDRLLDLGSGNGAFEVQLQRCPESPSSLFVSSIDFVGESLRRARARLLRDRLASRELNLSFIKANLNLVDPHRGIPMKSECFDGVIASFILSYVGDPQFLLHEIRRLLRPGGHLVTSSLRSDADISLLYVESVAEFRLGVAGSDLPGIENAELGVVAKNFLNDAARILQLEESGMFRFWESEDLKDLISNAGFSDVKVTNSLGSPPQALIISATRL
ncbi:MAG: methyltransferase domain-containing protein [Myxococcales bacterium]|nr:methyltransferase domain-containing protein [Myxococcales bacterium]